MLYKELTPHIALAPYIDAYWSVECTGQAATTNKILPDGCMDIIFNLGEDAGEIMPEHAILKNPVEGLNKLFLDRLRRPGHMLFPILEDIRMCRGLVRVEELAKRHFITVRQLERSFKYYIGVSPKEFINQVRFRYTLQRVSRRKPGEGLSDIAFECGYYDHSHLILEMKKYAGDLPGAYCQME